MLYEGVYDGKINLNKLEVSDGKWLKLKDLEILIRKNPNDFVPAFIKTYQIYKKEKR
jgi:isopentenyldiphosphate isomerase